MTVYARDETLRDRLRDPSLGVPSWTLPAHERPLTLTRAQLTALAQFGATPDVRGRVAGAVTIHLTAATGVFCVAGVNWPGEWWIDQRAQIRTDTPYPEVLDVDVALACAPGVLGEIADLATGDVIELMPNRFPTGDLRGPQVRWRCGNRSGELRA